MTTHAELSAQTQRTTFAVGDILGFQRGGEWNFMESDDLVAALLALDPTLPRWSAPVTLTDAQFKALRLTPVEILAAPGAGKYTRFHGAEIVVDKSGGVYTDLSSWGAVTVQCDTANVSNQLRLAQLGQASAADVAQLLPVTEPGSGDLEGTTVQYFSGVATLEDKPLLLAASNETDFGGGHASNSVRVRVLYSTHALP